MRPRPRPVPSEPVPAELAAFDPRYWAAEDEEPDKDGHEHDNWPGLWDFYAARSRWAVSWAAWMREHPEVDAIEWLRSRAGQPS